MSNRPWLRKLKVTLGPLSEWQGSTKGEIVTFESDGTLSGLRVTCSLTYSIMGMPSPSTIAIYNLGQEVRNGLRPNLTKITVEAGWQNTDMRKVFQGSVLSAYNERSGPDIITTLSCLPGYGALCRGVSSVTLQGGTSVKEGIKKLAADLPAITVDDSDLMDINGKIGSGGWSYSGSTREGLTQLSEEYGFSWSIQDGALTAMNDTFMIPEFIEFHGENGGLISVTPVVQGPLQVQTGVNVEAVYVPGFKAGHSLKVVSVLNPKLNGTYRANTVTANLDAYSDSWTMSISALKPGFV